MEFLLFDKLPPEVRDIIWAFALRQVEDKPEVWVVQENLAPLWRDHSRMLRDRLVYTAFPALAYVCSGSRKVALNPLNGIRFVDSSIGIPLPVRRVRPDLDVLYWDPDSDCVSSALAASRCRCLRATLARMSRLAIEPDSLSAAQNFVLNTCPAVRALYLVVPQSPRRAFVPKPGKYLTLRPVSDNTPAVSALTRACRAALEPRRHPTAAHGPKALNPRHRNWGPWARRMRHFELRITAAVMAPSCAW